MSRTSHICDDHHVSHGIWKQYGVDLIPKAVGDVQHMGIPIRDVQIRELIQFLSLTCPHFLSQTHHDVTSHFDIQGDLHLRDTFHHIPCPYSCIFQRQNVCLFAPLNPPRHPSLMQEWAMDMAPLLLDGRFVFSNITDLLQPVLSSQHVPERHTKSRSYMDHTFTLLPVTSVTSLLELCAVTIFVDASGDRAMSHTSSGCT